MGRRRRRLHVLPDDERHVYVLAASAESVADDDADAGTDVESHPCANAGARVELFVPHLELFQLLLLSVVSRSPQSTQRCNAARRNSLCTQRAPGALFSSSRDAFAAIA